MSLRKRLHLSFMAMILIPCVLFAITIFIVVFAFSGEEGIVNSTIDLQNIDNKNVILSDMKLLTTIEPTSFYDQNYLNEKSEKLKELNIALVIRIDKDITYNSQLFNIPGLENHLPAFGEFVNDIHNSVQIGEDAYKFEQHDFYFPDRSAGSIFLVKKATLLEQMTKKVMPFLLLLLIVIIVLTNGTLSYYVSRSILRPLQALQQATEHIKAGNLDFKIKVDRTDEIGSLMLDFEKMREKLKESIELQTQYEENRKLLISNISHDLKTPITSIKGYVEGIRDGVANTEEKQRKYINTIYKKAGELDSLIDELFLFSTLDLNRVPFYFDKLNIVQFIKDFMSDLAFDLENKGIDLQFQNELGPTVIVKADTEKLIRVFNNVIQNSIKYLDKTPGQIQLSIKEVDGLLRVAIEDNGTGINNEDVPFLFDSFYRADKSRNSKTGGTGLGLAISKQIIENHGGTIWAESIEGKGTTIYFTLQYADRNGDK